MAKNDVNINMNIDDNGDLKKLDKNARKAGKGLDKGAKGAHSMDRRLRGAAAMSSSSTKNFSKMSQGISGGLVPAYATLAASLFAVDAAFRALKRASDLRVQKEGMEAYASSTGIALKSIARDLQAATGYQLDFKEAAESASIAISAGFSADQVTAIGKAAKTASIALGRDFTDSYQRMLKGITKAEPELLDELGIILRLEKATKLYGAQIGKNAKDLTAYERQQAVFNEVIGQTATKYAAVGDSVPVSEMGRLGALFTDITDNFLKGIAPIAEFFGGVLVDSTNAAVAALGVFAASIIRSILPTMEALKISIATTWGAMKASGASAALGVRTMGTNLKAAKTTFVSTPGMGTSAAQKLAKGGMKGAKGAGMESLRAGGGLTKLQLTNLKKSLKNAEAQWIKHGAVVSGNLAGMNLKNIKNMQHSLKIIEGGHVKLWTAIKIGWKATFGTIWLGTKTMVSGFSIAMKTMKIAAVSVGRVLSKAMGLIGWIGMFVMMKDTFGSIGNMWDKILISIGGGMQKVGDWIASISNWLRPNSVIGKFMKWAGEGISGAGERVTAKGEALRPQMERQRRWAKFGKKGSELAGGIGERTADVIGMKGQWRGMGKDFDVRAAETQMLASTGALGDFSKLSAMQAQVGDWRNGLQLALKSRDPDAGKWVTEAREEIENMSPALEESTKNLITHYKELGKTDERYLNIAKLIGEDTPEAMDKARKELVRLTNEYGSHTQALKDMASAEEGRTKRIAEYVIQAESLSKYGLEVKQMAKSIGELSKKGFSAEKDLKTFWEMFPEATHIKELGLAIKYVNDQLKDQLDLSKGVRDAQLATAGGLLGTGIAASGSRGFKAKAQGEYAVLQAKERLAIWKRDSAMEKESLTTSIAAGGTDVELDAWQNRINIIDKTTAAYENLTNAQEKALTDWGRVSTAFKDSFESGMQKAFEGLITGTMNLKEAFANMAKSILQSMAKVLAQLMTEKLLRMAFGSFFGGVDTSSMMGAGDVRYGGIMSKPGYRSFARGGIATGNSGPGYLANLHGTEAVVPLGNDRSIPVKMMGGAGNTNNTSVTVNVAEGGTSSEVTGETGGAALGGVIAMAIEERLNDEQRPGGILYKPGGG